MTRTIYIILALFLLFSCDKGEDINPTYYDCKFNFTDSSTTNPNNNNYQSLLNGMTSSGVVGVMMSVYNTQTGMWIGASGKADLHNNIAMKPCNISRVGSTVKMFTATTVLKLAEEGKLNLDDKISS